MHVKELIKSVLDGERDLVKLQVAPLDYYIQLVKNEGGIEYETETNGWSVDFWVMFEHKQTEYILSGNLFYGDYKFSKYEN